jgi:hypothetical protein
VAYTDYHAQYFAHERTKSCVSSRVEELPGARFDIGSRMNATAARS